MKNHVEKRVLLIDTTANFSGGLVYVIEILPRLVALLPGWRIIAFGPRPSNCALAADHPDVTWITSNPGILSKGFVVRGILKLLWRQFILPYYALRLKADAVFSTANFSSFAFDLLNIPVVIALHNLVPFHSPDWYKDSTFGMHCRTRLLRAVTLGACRSKATFIVFSKYARFLLAKCGVHESRTHLAYHGAPTWDTPWTGADSMRALLVSNYFPYKRMKIVLEAWQKALPALPKGSHLLIQGVVGDTKYFNECRQVAQNLGISGSVEFGRGVPLEQLRTLYQTSRCLLFPAIGENCPITLLEAMRVGIPIIGTTADPVPEICGPAAVYAGDRNSDACASLIVRLFTEPTVARTLSELGRERSLSFSWDVAAERTAKHIMQVCETSYEQDSTKALARKRVAKNIP